MIKKLFLVCNTCFLLIISTPVFAQQIGTTETQRPKHWAKPLSITNNLYQIDDELFRSEQPLEDDINWLREHNIKTVISFRPRSKNSEIFPDGTISIINIPMRAWNVKDEQIADALVEIQKGFKNGSVLFHCYHGSDRTGLVAAMYRIIYQGWSIEEAKLEMKKGGYGFHSLWTNIDDNFSTDRIKNIINLVDIKEAGIK